MQLEEAGSKLSSSIPHVNGENRPFICSREDLEVRLIPFSQMT